MVSDTLSQIWTPSYLTSWPSKSRIIALIFATFDFGMMKLFGNQLGDTPENGVKIYDKF